MLELVQAADMVEMGMRRERDHAMAEQVLDGGLQLRNAHAGVDQQVGFRAPDVPDVAAAQGIDMRLPDQGDVVVDPLALEPALGDFEGHGVGSRVARRSRKDARSPPPPGNNT